MLNAYGYTPTFGRETLQTVFVEALQRHTFIEPNDAWKVWLIHESTLLALARQNTLGAVIINEFDAQRSFAHAPWPWTLRGEGP